MYTTNRALPRKLLSIAMALAMALTMTVGAFASDLRPWYADETTIKATINVSAQTYLVTVQAPSNTTQIKMQATLYQKQILGRKEISSMTGTANSSICTSSKKAAIEKGKTYVIEVTAQVYSGGSWNTVEDTITVKT